MSNALKYLLSGFDSAYKQSAADYNQNQRMKETLSREEEVQQNAARIKQQQAEQQNQQQADTMNTIQKGTTTDLIQQPSNLGVSNISNKPSLAQFGNNIQTNVNPGRLQQQTVPLSQDSINQRMSSLTPANRNYMQRLLTGQEKTQAQNQQDQIFQNYLASSKPMYQAGSNVRGLISGGNINLMDRPHVKNKDGSMSTVYSMSFNQDGKEILVPRVSDDGRILSNKEAIDQFHKTGKHLGIFDNVQDANKYAEQLHNQQSGLLDNGNKFDLSGATSQTLQRIKNYEELHKPIQYTKYTITPNGMYGTTKEGKTDLIPNTQQLYVPKVKARIDGYDKEGNKETEIVYDNGRREIVKSGLSKAGDINDPEKFNALMKTFSGEADKLLSLKTKYKADKFYNIDQSILDAEEQRINSFAHNNEQNLYYSLPKQAKSEIDKFYKDNKDNKNLTQDDLDKWVKEKHMSGEIDNPEISRAITKWGQFKFGYEGDGKNSNDQPITKTPKQEKNKDSSGFIEGKVYEDKNGNKAKYVNGKWEEVK